MMSGSKDLFLYLNYCSLKSNYVSNMYDEPPEITNGDEASVFK